MTISPISATYPPKYTNVLIQFIPPVLDIDDQPVGTPEYTIEIITPSSSKPGVYQSIPQRIVLPLSLTEPLKLRLLPSDLYLPLGRYQINYYRKGQSIPVHSEVWIVPTFPELRTYRLVFQRPEEPLALPADFYSMVYMNFNVPYEIRHNTIMFLGEHPNAGETVMINYKPAATRDKLVELGSSNNGPVRTI